MAMTKARRIQTASILFVVVTFLSMVMLNGCNGEDITGPGDHGVEAVVISPDSASFAVGEQREFSATLVDAQGQPVELDPSEFNIEWEWWSTNPDVFTVEGDGTATGQSQGEEFCIIEATILVGSSNFTGRDSAIVFVF